MYLENFMAVHPVIVAEILKSVGVVTHFTDWPTSCLLQNYAADMASIGVSV